MSLLFFEQPLFQVGGHYVTFLGLIAFVGLFAAGLIIARMLQSHFVRRFFSRFKIETNFVAIVTSILSLAALVFFTISAINAAGIPLAWNAPLPAVSLSLVQIFLLIALLIAVFWISSRTKRFLFNRFLVNSGLVILAERPITIGDRVEVAGITGQVQQIRARSTVIRTNDNITMIVPNTKFIDSPVTNWTYGDPRVRFRIPVGVAYGSDIAKVRETLLAAGRENPNTLKEPAPSVFLEKFGDSSIDFDLVVWSSEMSARPSRYRSDLNFAIEQKFREAGIEIAFPQRDLHIRSGALKVEGAGFDTTKRSDS